MDDEVMNSTSNMMVTIGIPTYNRAGGYLRNVIERSLGQTYQNLEVIVADNYSTDETPELVRSFEDSRLRYFRHDTNIGAINNFNFCLDQARGKYFLLFHDDDMIDVDFVETCISSLGPDQTTGAILTGVRTIDENDKVLSEQENRVSGLPPAEFIRGWFNNEVALYLCNTLYNTDNLREIGGFKSKKDLFLDLVVTFMLVTKFGRVDVPEIKASFRRHSSNRGSTIPIQDWVEESLYLLEVMCELLPEDCRSLTDEGKLYFCKKMYWYNSKKSKLIPRLVDYLRIYKSFDYVYSPRAFLAAK